MLSLRKAIWSRVSSTTTITKSTRFGVLVSSNHSNFKRRSLSTELSASASIATPIEGTPHAQHHEHHHSCAHHHDHHHDGCAASSSNTNANANANDKYFRFEILHQSSKSRARVGKIYTPHGVINTPGFVAVGTNGTLKLIDNVFAQKTIGLELMFSNTYHLLVHPGPEVVKKAGGLHKYINRTAPIITDSGGFQVFSLAYGAKSNDELKGRHAKKDQAPSLLKITEDGVTFRSYRDGKKIVLTPESAVDAQKCFGADIIIPLDELPPYSVDKDKLLNSLHRTHRWEKRSLERHLANPQQQAMYCVLHGGVDEHLRQMSIDTLCGMPFDGIGIGGSLGKNRHELVKLLEFVMPRIPYEKPNHLLGIGDLESIPKSIVLGVDTFDSTYPSRAGRHGTLFTEDDGMIKLTRGHEKHLHSFDLPIDKKCTCYVCQHYSRGYLYHLYKSNEPTAQMLGTVHNLHFMVKYMERLREKIMCNEI